MKAQLTGLLLSLCLITSMVICPGLVFWEIWQNHREVVNVSWVDPPLFNPPASSIVMMAGLSCIISAAIGFRSGQWLNRRHQTYRHTTLQQQVATLEKIW